MALGALWYSPALFGKKWMAYMGYTLESMKEHQKEARRGYVLSFVTALVMAYVLALFVDYAGAETIAQGVKSGFWIWLGFVATVTMGSVLWEQRPWGLYILNNAFQLLSLLIMGSILAVWI